MEDEAAAAGARVLVARPRPLDCRHVHRQVGLLRLVVAATKKDRFIALGIFGIEFYY